MANSAGNIGNLIPNSARTPEELREQTRKAGIASGVARREKKRMTQIYAEFLEKKHKVLGKDGINKEMSGTELLSSVMSKVLSRGDSSSVSLLREIREATEGSKMALTGQDGEPLQINILGVKAKD
jgi:hypothetical protein